MQAILQAARLDILEALSFEPLLSRHFDTAIRIAKLAEELAAGDGKPDLGAVKQYVVRESEFLAKHMNAALVADFANGNTVLTDKYRRLQNTHVELESKRLALDAASMHVEAERNHIQAERKALDKLREALQLGDGGKINLPPMPELSEGTLEEGTLEEGTLEEVTSTTEEAKDGVLSEDPS